MRSPVEKWYQNVSIEDFKQNLEVLPPIFLLEEFESVYRLFESPVVDQEKVSALYDVVHAEMLRRLS